MKNKVYWVICICPLWLFLSNCVDKFNAHFFFFKQKTAYEITR